MKQGIFIFISTIMLGYVQYSYRYDTILIQVEDNTRAMWEKM